MAKYKPLTGEVTGKAALKQAARALDLAGGLANEVKDTDTLLAVSKLWLDVIDAHAHVVRGPDEEAPVHQIGFAPNRLEDENERIEDTADRAHEGQDRIIVQDQSGQL